MQTLAASEFEHIKDLLRDKTIFMVIDESEISKTKYLNVLVGDTAAPEKTYFVTAVLYSLSIKLSLLRRWMIRFETLVFSETISCSF